MHWQAAMPSCHALQRSASTSTVVCLSQQHRRTLAHTPSVGAVKRAWAAMPCCSLQQCKVPTGCAGCTSPMDWKVPAFTAVRVKKHTHASSQHHCHTTLSKQWRNPSSPMHAHTQPCPCRRKLTAVTVNALDTHTHTTSRKTKSKRVHKATLRPTTTSPSCQASKRAKGGYTSTKPTRRHRANNTASNLELPTHPPPEL